MFLMPCLRLCDLFLVWDRSLEMFLRKYSLRRASTASTLSEGTIIHDRQPKRRVTVFTVDPEALMYRSWR